MKRLAIGTMAVVLLGLLGSAPAEASGTDAPSITSPADGSAVPRGWSGPLTVDFSNAPVATYRVKVSCRGETSPALDEEFTSTDATTVHSFTLTRGLNAYYEWLNPPCQASVQGGGQWTYNMFGVDDPQPALVSPGPVADSSWAGPLTIDFRNAELPGGQISFALECADGFRQAYVQPLPAGEVTFPVSAEPGPGWCELVNESPRYTFASFKKRPVPPVIVTPTNGSTRPYEEHTPLVLDFTDASQVVGWQVEIYCPERSGVVFYKFLDPGEATGVVEYATDKPVPGGQTCKVQVRDLRTYSIWSTSSFTTSWPELATPSPTLNRTVFYPRVRDGYLDTLSASYRINRAAHVSRQVLSSTGAVVDLDEYDETKAPRTATFTWDGRRSDGSLAPVGDYRIRIIAVADGVTRSATSPVFKVATKQAWDRRTLTKTGNLGTAATSGACSVFRNSTYLTALLACNGGSYARMTYGFAIPSSAKNIVFGVAGDWAAGDRCCNGSLRKYGARPSATLYRVSTQVSGTRQYLVRRAALSFDYLRTY